MFVLGNLEPLRDEFDVVLGRGNSLL